MAFAPVWPLVGPVSAGFFSSHTGIDIAVPDGTPVRAVAAGTVSLVTYDSLEPMPPELGYAGFYVEVSHEEGWLSRYLHLQPFSNTVAEGDPVACGQVIGLADSTGSITGPHLHLALWNEALVCPEAVYVPSRNLYACDPLVWLPLVPPGECPQPPVTRIAGMAALLSGLAMVVLGMIATQRRVP